MKTIVRLFVPPIIWSMMARLRKRTVSVNVGSRRSLSNSVTGSVFTIPFHKVTQDRGVYFVPIYGEHRPASQAVLNGEVYEPATHALIDSIMMHRPGSMIHAGTFFGDMLPTFARSCKGVVYAFEPVLESYVLAKLCVEANEIENVFLQNAGLSDRISIARIDTGGTDEQHRGGTSQVGNAGQSCALTTIDSLGLDDVVLIQLDVEGHELAALKGARATIARNAPIILIEDNLRTCSEFLKELAYIRVGEIPGLSVWALLKDRSMLKDLLRQG